MGMLSMEVVSVSIMGDTTRTLEAYARKTGRTIEQVATEALADWAETVAEPRLEVLEEPIVKGIHLVN